MITTPSPRIAVADHTAYWKEPEVRRYHPRFGPEPCLTSREAEVAFAICEGKTGKEIAAALFISAKTVEKHRQTLHKKWGVHSAIDVLKEAVARGHYVIPPHGEISDTERLDHHLKHMESVGVRMTREDIDRSILASRIVAPANPYAAKAV